MRFLLCHGPSAVGVLLNFIDEWLLPINKCLRKRKSERIAFEDLWQLFQPGDEVVRKVKATAVDYANRTHMVMRVLKSSGGRYRLPKQDLSAASAASEVPVLTTVNGLNPFMLDVHRIDFDGSKMVPVVHKIMIQPFSGTVDIKELDAYPIDYITDQNFKSALVDRGRKFAQYVTKIVHLQCKGIDLQTREQLDGQVIVDMGEYYNTPGIDVLAFVMPSGKDIMFETNDCSRGVECISGNHGCYHRSANYLHDEFMDDDLMELHMQEEAVFQWDTSRPSSTPQSSTLNDRDLLRCSYGVFAFMLRTRQWGKALSRLVLWKFVDAEQ